MLLKSLARIMFPLRNGYFRCMYDFYAMGGEVLLPAFAGQGATVRLVLTGQQICI